MPGQTRMLTGTVVSDKMAQTVVVLVETTTRHRLYRKILKRSKRYMAHDDRLEAKTGDLVRIAETRPLSRHKRWRVVEVVQRRDVAEVAPREIDADYITLTREREQPETPPARAAADVPETAAEAAMQAPEPEAIADVSETAAEAVGQAPEPEAIADVSETAAEAVGQAPEPEAVVEAGPAPSDEPPAVEGSGPDVEERAEP